MSVFSGGYANYTPLINTITTELQTIQGLIDPSGSIDLSGVYSRQDIGNTILADICDDLSSYFASQDTILVNISNGIGAIDTSVLVDICSGIDTLVNETQSTNATLGSIDGFALKIDDALQPKAFSIFQTASAPALPFSGNFVNTPCVWKKIVCETAQTTINNTGSIISTFYDTSGTPAGTEPVLLRLNHPAVHTYGAPASSSNFGTAFHDITFPDGGLIVNDGIGVICSGTGTISFNSVALTGYYTP